MTLPWSETGKDVYQQLYDKGFALAALLEGTDNARLTNENTNISIVSEYLERLSGLDEELNFWYREVVRESLSPLYWHTQSTSFGCHLKEIVEPRTVPPFAFHTLRLAHIIVTYWALRLILSNTIAFACQHVLSTNNRVPSSSFISHQTSQEVETMTFHLLEIHTRSHRLELAKNIIRSMPYCLSDNMGLMGPQKSLFALRTALFALQRYPGEELKWCRAMYQELDSRKGLRYAREIAKLDGGFSAVGIDHLPL